MDRRTFIKYLALFKSYLNSSRINISQNKYLNIPPLYCIAYIDPSIEEQQGQEFTISKYPLSIVPQGSRNIDLKWKDKIKTYNPDHIMLGYHVVIEESTVPGRGHDVMRKIKKSWLRKNGDYILVKTGPNKYRKIYDPRNYEWQMRFIEAIKVLVDTYDYQGIFLDQCTIYNIASDDKEERLEMLDSLKTTIKTLREELPTHILIGNSRYNFESLNGEMNENRPNELINEIQGKNHEPLVNLFQVKIKDINNTSYIKKMANFAIKNKCLFGVTDSYQKVYWTDIHHEIYEDYHRLKLNY